MAGGSGNGGLRPDGGACAPRDAGPVSCTVNCGDGFTCQGGTCVLNGGSGPVQITLRWNTSEDLDLHVDEPRPNGGTCEIYYGNSNRPTGTSSCGAVGSLDLDSNPGCSYDGVEIENVIYPPGTAPSGHYFVRVDHYANCSPLTQVPFELEVRYLGYTVGICAVFLSTDGDWSASSGANGGRRIFDFTVP